MAIDEEWLQVSEDGGKTWTAKTWEGVGVLGWATCCYHTSTQIERGKLLLVGGLDKYLNFIPSPKLLDCNNGFKAVVVIEAIQYERTEHSATRVGEDEVLLFGGEDEEDKYRNDAQILTLITLKGGADMKLRVAHTSGKAPCPRINHGAAFLGGAVYVYGGWGDDR